VKYLLDVNTLVALGNGAHAQHDAAELWLKRMQTVSAELGSSPICDLGFVRVSVQAGLQPDVASARNVLARMKASAKIALWSDSIGMEKLPAYVMKPVQLTDGHLIEVARSHGAKLATLDKGIPGSELII
jgi:predicted nucleic acid-binding protein